MEREHYEESDTGHAIKRASEEQRVVEENGGKHGGARIRLPGKPDEERRAQVDHQRQKARLWRKKRATFGAKCKEKAQSVNCLPNPRNIPKPRKEPLPMCKRALPESFWTEPVTMQTSSLSGNVYSRFPPLFSSDNNNCDMDIAELRPLTPPGEASHKSVKKSMRYVTSPADTELLFSLFDKFEKRIDERLIVKRGRPKKIQLDSSYYSHPPKKEEDPCMVDDLSEKLFPQLSLNNSSVSNVPKHAVIKLPNGSKTVELPAIQLAKHYPVMLDQLAMHL